jgi:transposase InsO family protein
MMSWKESDRVSQRLEFVRLAVVRGANVSALCERFGVSRKTGYKWIDRWKSDGLEGLKDKCRRPLVSPGRTGDDVEQIIIKLRTKHPQWGGRTLRKRLQVLGHTDVPSASSITRILHRHGLISRDATEKHQAWDRFERTEPNDLWQIDYKGDFLLANGTRCYPLTLLDDHSRYSLGIIACDNQRQATAKEHFRGVFTRYGIPRAIYVDNGNPWGTSGSRTRHSRLSAWLMRQDIEVIHGRPYHPQGRGKIERFHRTLNQEVLQDRELSNLVEAQGVFDPWRDVYNLERPHQGLNLESVSDQRARVPGR